MQYSLTVVVSIGLEKLLFELNFNNEIMTRHLVIPKKLGAHIFLDLVHACNCCLYNTRRLRFTLSVDNNN